MFNFPEITKTELLSALAVVVLVLMGAGAGLLLIIQAVFK